MPSSAWKKIDRDLQISWHTPDEIHQRRELPRLKVGAHLHQHRPELVPHLPHSLEKHLRRAGDIAQPLLVGDFLWELEREHESLRCPVYPATDRRRGGGGVEGRIDRNLVEPPR